MLVLIHDLTFSESIGFILLLLKNPLLLIVDSLLLLNIFEHVLVLRQYDIIREHFGEFLIELVHLRKPLEGFLLVIEPLEELADVVEDQIIFEN